MEKLTIKQLMIKSKEFKNVLKDTDNEAAHQIEDDVYREFIRGIHENLYTYGEIQTLTIIIKNNFCDAEYDRWYA